MSPSSPSVVCVLTHVYVIRSTITLFPIPLFIHPHPEPSSHNPSIILNGVYINKLKTLQLSLSPTAGHLHEVQE